MSKMEEGFRLAGKNGHVNIWIGDYKDIMLRVDNKFSFASVELTREQAELVAKYIEMAVSELNSKQPIPDTLRHPRAI